MSRYNLCDRWIPVFSQRNSCDAAPLPLRYASVAVRPLFPAGVVKRKPPYSMQIVTARCCNRTAYAITVGWLISLFQGRSENRKDFVTLGRSFAGVVKSKIAAVRPWIAFKDFSYLTSIMRATLILLRRAVCRQKLNSFFSELHWTTLIAAITHSAMLCAKRCRQ